MTQNAPGKKNQNETYKMIIKAQFIYEGTLNAFGTTTFAVFSFFHDHVWNLSLNMANHLSHMKLVANPERDSSKHRYKLIE